MMEAGPMFPSGDMDTDDTALMFGIGSNISPSQVQGPQNSYCPGQTIHQSNNFGTLNPPELNSASVSWNGRKGIPQSNNMITAQLNDTQTTKNQRHSITGSSDFEPGVNVPMTQGTSVEVQNTLQQASQPNTSGFPGPETQRNKDFGGSQSLTAMYIQAAAAGSQAPTTSGLGWVARNSPLAKINSETATPSGQNQSHIRAAVAATQSPIAHTHAGAIGPPPAPASTGQPTKYATDAERKQALGLALKARRSASLSKLRGTTPPRSSSVSSSTHRLSADRQMNSAIPSQNSLNPIREAFSRNDASGRLSNSAVGTFRSSSDSDSDDSSTSSDDSPRSTPKPRTNTVVDATTKSNPPDGEEPIPPPPEDQDDGEWEPDEDSDSVHTSSEPPSPTSPYADDRDLEKTQTKKNGPKIRLFVPPKGRDMTGDGRPYTRYDDGLGAGMSGNYGVLLPTGYLKSNKIPNQPWVCPIRGCLRAFPQKYNLGSHFLGSHRGIKLHDYRDGSFENLGYYNQNSDGTTRTGSWPPVVVSIEPEPKGGPLLRESSSPQITSGSLQIASGTSSHRTQAPPSDAKEVPGQAVSLARASNQNRPATHAQPWSPSNQLAPEILWGWLRPHLNRHRDFLQPPTNGWVKELVTLPRVRDIEWQTSWVTGHPFLDSKPRDVSSLIIQVTGEPAPEPCDKCKAGKGPYKACIMISRSAHPGPLGSVFACANCFYHFGQTYCTHKWWGEQRFRALSQGRPIPTYRSTTEVSGERLNPRYNASKTPKATANDMMYRTSNGKPTTLLRSPPPIVSDLAFYEDPNLRIPSQTPMPSQSQTADGSVPASFASSASGRRYNTWQDYDKKLLSTQGALIPDGYQQDKSNPTKPWVCPILTCRQLYRTLPDLGAHFTTRHKCKVLNDNCDGTLSIKGVYKSTNPLAPPLVVSRNSELATSVESALVPKGSQPPPVTTTSATTSAASQVSHGAGRVLSAPNSSSLPVKLGDVVKIPRDINATIGKSLRDAPIFPENAAFVQSLIDLPQARYIQFNLQSAESFHFKYPVDVSAVIIQITGESFTTPCTECASSRGPFKGCVGVSKDASAVARETYQSCANCTYRGRQNQCSLKPTLAKRIQESELGTTIQGNQERRNNRRTFAKMPRSGVYASSRDGALTETAAAATAALAPEVGMKRKANLQADVDDDDEYVSEDEISAVSDSLKRRMLRPPQNTPKMNRQPAPTTKTALVAPGQVQNKAILEMEDWELAPGKIKESNATTANTKLPRESIAFSKSFLASGNAAQVCDDVRFSVKTIQSGCSLKIEPDGGSIRLCSVASGKLRVRAGPEPEFVIGPHGLFKVKPGVACSVENRLYVDAILHVTTVSDAL